MFEYEDESQGEIKDKDNEIVRLQGLVMHYQTKAEDLMCVIEKLREDLKDEQELVSTYFAETIANDRRACEAEKQVNDALRRAEIAEEERKAVEDFQTTQLDLVERAQARAHEAILAEQQTHKMLLEAHAAIFNKDKELRELRRKAGV